MSLQTEHVCRESRARTEATRHSQEGDIVPEYVGRDAFLAEAGMRPSGSCCMLFE